MSGNSMPVECSVEYQWRFEAPLGAVGVPTKDGRVLAVPEIYDGPKWAGKLPAPVMAYTRVSRPGDGQGGFDHRLVPVARIERIIMHEAELTALGRFWDDELSRHYAGALAVDAVAMAVNVDTSGTGHSEEDGVVTFTDWKVAGVVMVHDSPWPAGLLSRPRVWREKVVHR